MILFVYRTGMMMVVRVGARLIRRMGKNPPARIVCGARLARPCLSFEILMKLVECWRHHPREIEHQEQRCAASHATRPAGLKNSTTHVTKPASDPGPLPIRWNPIRRNRDVPRGGSRRIRPPDITNVQAPQTAHWTAVSIPDRRPIVRPRHPQPSICQIDAIVRHISSRWTHHLLNRRFERLSRATMQ